MDNFFNDHALNEKEKFIEQKKRERLERIEKAKKEKELKEKKEKGLIIYKYYQNYKQRQNAKQYLINEWELTTQKKPFNENTNPTNQKNNIPSPNKKGQKLIFNEQELLWLGRVFCYLQKNKKSTDYNIKHTSALSKIYLENNLLPLFKNEKTRKDIIYITKQFLWICINVVVSESSTTTSTTYNGQELIYMLKYIDAKYYQKVGVVLSNDKKKPQENGKEIEDGNSIANSIQEFLKEKGMYQLFNEVLSKKMNLFTNNRKPIRPMELWINVIIRSSLLPIEYDSSSIRDNDYLKQCVKSRTLHFLLHILSIPILGTILSDQGVKMIEQSQIIQKGIELLQKDDQSRRILFNQLEGEKTMFLAANLVYFVNTLKMLSSDNKDKLFKTSYSRPHDKLKDSTSEASLNPKLNDIIIVLTCLFLHCQKFVHDKNTESSSAMVYHPIFNWYSGEKKENISLDLFKDVIQQLSYIWSIPFMLIAFKSILDFECGKNSVSVQTMLSIDMKDICNFYLSITKILNTQRLEIFNAIAYLPNLIPMFWRFMNEIGPKKKMEIFLNSAKFPSREPLISLLEFFCRSCHLLFLTIDDQEIYEKQKPFTLEELKNMSYFLNNFCFQMYWQESAQTHKEILDSTKQLLLLLYDRNDRRPFTPDMNWTIKEIKSYTFLANVRKKDELSISILENIPHVIPFKIRVEIFRDFIKEDKEKLVKSTQKNVYLIRRPMILEDGYQQLGRLNVYQFKQTIRIKFVSAHGYEEAGIDQSGVFKEFLEEICKAAFDPTLNLFKTTSEGWCSPSPTSYIQEGHLNLFEFIGKILGKALYEEIVIDFPFAQFFYAKLQSRFNTFDDLPSLDPELYKNLIFLKHYDGDCEDLGLTFTVDQDIFGKVETIDIKPGGSAINVTNENRYQYIYLVADYMLNQQCKKQNKAFIRGFKSIISEQWLKLFSPAELQKLISGESIDIDISDLRKYTHYEGGYFEGHKTIRSFWNVLNSFSEKEKRLFLKFVTSCSKPPVGGFEYLNPPLTIRYVPITDKGDVELKPFETIKSVFGLAKDTTRLPTASTCFNLLKLPAYQKKSTLKEKLKYAINAGAGFELS